MKQNNIPIQILSFIQEVFSRIFSFQSSSIEKES